MGHRIRFILFQIFAMLADTNILSILWCDKFQNIPIFLPKDINIWCVDVQCIIVYCIHHALAKAPLPPLAHHKGTMNIGWTYMEKNVWFRNKVGNVSFFCSKLLNPFVICRQKREENRKSPYSYPFYGKRTDLRFW